MYDEPRGLTLEPDRSSRHSVGIHASPAEVYHALTDPQELSRWFVSEAAIDLRPGGQYRWVFGEATGSSGSAPLVTAGEFLQIVPQEALRLRTRVEDLETQIEFRLDPWRDGTVLTVSHAGFPGEEEWDETFRDIDQGWDSEIQILKLYLEKARGMVRRSRFHEARIAAPAEDVYERFTTPPGITSWLAERAASDPERGGELRLEWDGLPTVEGRFVVWDPDRFLVMTWLGGGATGAAGPSVVRVWLEETAPEGGTDLSLEHRLFAPDPGRFAPFDWDAALQRLTGSVRSAATP